MPRPIPGTTTLLLSLLQRLSSKAIFLAIQRTNPGQQLVGRLIDGVTIGHLIGHIIEVIGHDPIAGPAELNTIDDLLQGANIDVGHPTAVGQELGHDQVVRKVLARVHHPLGIAESVEIVFVTLDESHLGSFLHILEF